MNDPLMLRIDCPEVSEHGACNKPAGHGGMHARGSEPCVYWGGEIHATEEDLRAEITSLKEECRRWSTTCAGNADAASEEITRLTRERDEALIELDTLKQESYNREKMSIKY